MALGGGPQDKRLGAGATNAFSATAVFFSFFQGLGNGGGNSSSGSGLVSTFTLGGEEHSGLALGTRWPVAAAKYTCSTGCKTKPACTFQCTHAMSCACQVLVSHGKTRDGIMSTRVLLMIVSCFSFLRTVYPSNFCLLRPMVNLDLGRLRISQPVTMRVVWKQFWATSVIEPHSLRV